MNQDQISLLQQLLDSPKKIVVIGHKNPDGDAVGSCLGLSGYLNSLGHNSRVIMPNDFPKFLKWLPDCDKVIIYEQQQERAQRMLTQADLIFTLDFNALNRTGDLGVLLEQAQADFVMVDHHQQPDDYAKVTISDPTMSSTAEMVFHLIHALEGESYIDADLATNLYTGIMTDTGSFRFPSTTAVTHRAIASLIEKGANGSDIHRAIYDTNRPEKLKLLGTALENMVHLPEFRTAYITLSQKELDDHNFKKGDTEGFVNYALSLNEVILAAIFIENKQESITKISLRSTGSFSVNEMARTHFNGGGHINAAGGRSVKSLPDTVADFLAILPTYQNALNDTN
ncbi:DHH family phosphoesterase [Aureitalea marina]|uniref:DHH family phosphoesterase n=1 Tax=Aureitalea marina TaxID=930804 RepID=A0A2S7KQ08_9FLAO|nr:bifunctional oligoribonuclease/PAP phosphatase NrnA [Aureitalea marina]PQB04700.1 DHH family phosphoesterase [Aureitalea marina]